MSQYGFYIDLVKCTGCKTCVIACKDAHSLSVGTNYRKVIEFVEGNWKKDANGAWVQDVRGYYVPIACNECADPACVKVCPTKAHFKRESDGIVLIDEKKCIGCGACAKACPYGAPVLNETAHKMHKCDACVDRLAQGLLPICVEACPQRAIEFGEISELRKKYGENADIAPLPSSNTTKPSLVIRLPLNMGKQG
ncbi:DMSO/selenate family reductase complex B subunit [Parasutterella excrementihominis]|jgi:anaerobic dimethyl sulfoxide reductase subunit B (iron-sulfur subunit)|uniref:DMSO/selenate family reductase complex B subunit n=1 Tax=Parasutterella excrementihominis TaxID=487175 RepID=UPI003A909EAA